MNIFKIHFGKKPFGIFCMFVAVAVFVVAASILAFPGQAQAGGSIGCANCFSGWAFFYTTGHLVHLDGGGGGGGGCGGDCNPPPRGCVVVDKETFNTLNQPLTPVAQFTFTLDGGAPITNDASGFAQFDNVPVGQHTIAEVVPPTWQQVSIVPAGGVVNVVAGTDCAHVTFKNKQNITPPPPACTLHATANPDPLPVGGGSVTVTWSSTNATNGMWVPGGDNAGTSGTATFNNITETTTFKIHFTGPGGSVDCQDIVTVPPPPSACIQILKETYDSNNNPITPVAPFTFKLDGGVTVQNDSAGNAQFNNVTPGNHQITEVLPSGWTQLSVTPVNGNVHVTAGPTCAAVVFKNKQNPPPGECHLTITKSANITSADVGDQVEYTINFKNDGGADCTGDGVEVKDVVDPLLTYNSQTHSSNVTPGYGSASVYTSSNRTLLWNAGTLTPGETGWVKWKGTFGTPSACTVTVPNKAKITSFEYNNFQDWVESNVVNVDLSKNCSNPPPSCTLNANPATLTSPNPTTLSWTTTNATSFVIDHAIGSVTPVPAGSTTTPVISSNITYTGTATGPGGTATCSAPVTITAPNTPACTLTVSKSDINTGESVKVSWTSSDVTSGSISPQVGAATPVASGTSADVFPPSDTTYTGTFTGPDGTVTCTVLVRVHTSGCTGNCGGGYNPPNIVLFQKPGETPLASVFLSQIPYTGFEAGPTLTLLFWLAVALFSAIVAYYVVGKGSMQFVYAHIAKMTGVPMGSTVYEFQNEEPTYEETYGPPHPAVEVEPAPVVLSAVAAPAPKVVMTAATAYSAPEPSGIPEIENVIESRAHAAGVLMSPESVQLTSELSNDRAQALVMFGNILNEAVKTLPREDGWIMMTSDRFETLAGKQGTANAVSSAPVSAPTPVSAPVETLAASADEASAVAFAHAVLSNDRETAFAIIRSLEHDAVNPTSLMTGVATVLDRLYRVRQGGKNGIDQNLVDAAVSLSDEKLHSLVETFTHALDTVYANPFTGIKLALGQAFELLG